jgi:phosphohistidine phosphatase SixA
MTKMKRPMFLLLLALAAAPPAAAQAVFVVRHAERADAASGGNTMMASDPDLSKAGQARAASLAEMLRDSGIEAIFATEYKRAQQTGAPLAKRLGVAVQTVPAKDTAGLIARLKAVKGSALVIGHSNTVPEIIKGLGVSVPVTIGEADYDNLFVVTRDGRPPSLLHLHYR